MIIREPKLTFKSLILRKATRYAVIHHVAGDSTVEKIHAQHLGQGWAGIGYHFFIDFEGIVYRGRPYSAEGAHVLNQNSDKIGICLNGNLDVRKPTDAQIKSLVWLLGEIKKDYPGIKIVGHGDLMATNCPGRYVNVAEIAAQVEEGGDLEVRYQKAGDIPAGDLRNAITKLLEQGHLKGDQNGNLDLSMDMIRILTVIDRIGLYGATPKKSC